MKNSSTQRREKICKINQVDNIAKLFKKELGLKINRSTVYLHKKKRHQTFSKEKRKGIENLLKEKKI